MDSAVVIGAGIGGLALAIRLQSAGVATTLVEARDRPGGHAYAWEKDGFTFDAGPAAIAAPDALRELWALSGRAIADDVTLVPVDPYWRLSWPDGTSFDHAGDEALLRAEIARIEPGDIAGYARLLDHMAALDRDGAAPPPRGFGAVARAAPALVRRQAWRSVHATVSRFVANDKLRQALGFHALTIGGNPMTASALHAALHKQERDGGVWFAMGGTGQLAAGMARLFERLGGTLRLNAPVAAIDTLGDRATGVTLAGGERIAADAVASNADLIHTYRRLLPTSRSARRAAARLERKRFSPSMFVVHFGIRGTWPGIPHRSVLFGPRYAGLFADIHDHGLLSADGAIVLHHPTVTDPGMAPPGHSTFSALAPVPHLGKFPADWAQVGPVLEKRILDEVGRRLIPDIHERIVTKFSYSPADFRADMNAHLGSAFSLEPIPAQSAWFRAPGRDDAIANLYFVGAGTHPGAGIPGVVASARTTAGLMLEEQGK